MQFDDAILKFNNKTADHPQRKVFMYPVSIPYAVQKYTSFSLVYLIEINNVADICKYIPSGQTTRSDVLFVLLAMSLCKFRLWNILLPVRSICRMCYVTYVFIQRQRNDGHLDFTNQSSGNYFELCQLLFGCLFFSEPVNVDVWCY